MAKLVAFYSRAGENYFGGQYRSVTIGNTEKVANLIAETIGGNLFKIEQKVPYSPHYKYCTEQALAHKKANVRPELVKLPDNLAVYTFLEAFDWTGKTIHPFCTHEGSGLSGTERKIAATCQGANVKKGLAICGSCVSQSGQAVLQWLKQNEKDGL